MQRCLIAGNPSAFTQALIDRLDREDIRVFALSTDKTGGHQDHAFEHYQFDDAGESVSNVIVSCRPDVLIFMGAWDTCFIRDDARAREARRNYVTTLSNLLISANKQGVRHFVYLSSECVFSDNYISDIVEDMPASPDTHEQMVIFQGETLALRYNQMSTMEVTVVRLGGLYTTPRAANDCVDVCTAMCLKALCGDTISVNDKHIMSALYVSDAVEGIYCLLSAPTRKRNLYHIASAESFTERDLARVVSNSMMMPVRIEDATTGLTTQRLLSSAAFNNEFHFSARVSYRETIPRIIAAMQTHMRDFLKDGARNANASKLARFFLRAISYIELLAGFVVCMLATGAVSAAIPSINLFLLYSLLFSIFYGSRHGIIAASLSAIGYCLLGLSGRSGLELLIDINTYVWIAQVFIVALAAGNVRDQLTQNKRDMGEEISFLSSRVANVSRINDSNVLIKNFFESHMVDSDEGIGHIYSIIADMDKAESGAVLFAATRILMQFMGTKDVAIYRVLDSGYSRIAASSSPRARTLGKSVTLADYPELDSAIREKRVYINRRLNSDLPFLADTLADPEGHVRFAVLLWDLNYEHMTLYYINLLRVICALITNAVTRSSNFEEAIAHTRLIEGTDVMNTEAFDNLLRVYREASEQHLADYCLLSLPMNQQSLQQWDQALSATLRHTDTLGMLNDQTLGILLTNTSVQEGTIVINRLHSKGMPVNIAGGR